MQGFVGKSEQCCFVKLTQQHCSCEMRNKGVGHTKALATKIEIYNVCLKIIINKNK
jgi:hypothetical protein